MRRWTVAGAGLLLAGCAAGVPGKAPLIGKPGIDAAAAPVPPIVLRNAGFEEDMPAGARCATGWGCTMHNNLDAFRFYLVDRDAAEGRRSFCVEQVAQETWALVVQAFDGKALRGKRVRLSLAVRVDGVTGAGAGPWSLSRDRPRIREQRLVKGTAGWQRQVIELAVPESATQVELGAVLEGGGRACFDDARVEVLQP